MKMLLLASNVFALRKLTSVVLIAVVFSLLSSSLHAQQDSAYRQTIKERSAKIVNTLEITDQARYAIVLDQVMNQYFDLNKIHTDYKESSPEKSSKLLQLHNAFIGHLKENLTDAQIDKIKDGMTYSVLHVTYAAYQDKIPSLTAAQKDKIYAWLKEARELAMDEGSSDDKHKVFGKYKGRINNYLSDEGYDLKKEEKDWQARLKERKEQEAQKKNTQN